MTQFETIAVVLAGGIGTRVGSDVPKQLREIAGRSVLAHTLAVFQEAPGISEIVLVMADAYRNAAQQIIADGGFTRVTSVLAGGRDRSESTQLALRAIGNRAPQVLIHDAARPLVTGRIIHESIEALSRYDALTVAIPSSDSMISVNPSANATTKVTESVLQRDRLMRVQTPQCFKTEVIVRAYAKATADPNFSASDDASVVLTYLPDTPVGIVEGDARNFKITDATDLFLAEKLLER